MSYVTIEKLRFGDVYRIRSRNLLVGAWQPDEKGFIGLREKFGSTYLFTEYHYDIGPPLGTVMPEEKLGRTPDGMSLTEFLGRGCSCGRAAESTGVEFIPGAEKQGPYYRHIDDQSPIEWFDPHHRVNFIPNTALFDFLKPFDDVERARLMKELG